MELYSFFFLWWTSVLFVVSYNINKLSIVATKTTMMGVYHYSCSHTQTNHFGTHTHNLKIGVYTPWLLQIPYPSLAMASLANSGKGGRE